MASNDGSIGNSGPARADWRMPGALCVLVSVALLTGCGAKNKDKDKDASASQTAAKVNKEEITVHQINYVLSQQRAAAPQRSASAGEQVLERLIDQELALQKAADQKIDRDPRVIQQIESARREIVSRAYLEKIGQGAPKPTPAEIKAYYDSHPALFSNRRVYAFREVIVEATPDQLPAVRARLDAAKDLAEFVASLKASGTRYSLGEAVRGAEQLPLQSLDTVASMKDGQTLFTPTPLGASVLYLVSSQSQPIAADRAAPAIEQFLLNDRRRRLMEDDLKALRSSAKIEYVGSYAADHAKAVANAPPPAPEAPPLTSIAPPMAPGASAAPQIEVAPTPVSAASMPTNAILDKGLQGMK